MKYRIEGDTLPVVICELESGETMITESGAMSWMTPNMKMETTSNGGIGKAFGRMFAGENLALRTELSLVYSLFFLLRLSSTLTIALLSSLLRT